MDHSDIPDISSDDCSSINDEAGQSSPACDIKEESEFSTAHEAAAHLSGSETEDDEARQTRHHNTTRQIAQSGEEDPKISNPATSAIEDGFGHCLVACESCTSEGRGLDECLGGRHCPRLEVVRGQSAILRNCKALLQAGHRDKPSASSGGGLGGSHPGESEADPFEVLVATPSNLELMFTLPCDRCAALGACASHGHPHQVKSLADLLGSSASETLTPRGRPIAAKRRMVNLQDGWVELPRMISIAKTPTTGDFSVSLALSLRPFFLHSECREDVPGDFEVSHNVAKTTKGSSNFMLVKGPAREAILRLRALRDVLSWKYGLECRVHPLVAAKVFFLWENTHPREQQVLTALLERGVDKEFSFEIHGEVPRAVFKASHLRSLYSRRFEETTAILESLTKGMIESGRLPAEEAKPVSAEHRGRGSPECSDSGVPCAAARSAGHVESARNVLGSRRVGRAEEVAGMASSLSEAPDQQSVATVSIDSAAGERIGKVVEDILSPRRKPLNAVLATDGVRYMLPLCIREKSGRINLYISIRRFMVDGEAITNSEGPYDPLQKPFGAAEITRENLLGLRALRDVVYRNPVVHPLVAASVFEEWENCHPTTIRRDGDVVTITGAACEDGEVPEGKFTAGELRKFRGAARRTAADELFETLRSSAAISGELEEVPPDSKRPSRRGASGRGAARAETAPAANGITGPKKKRRRSAKVPADGEGEKGPKKKPGRPSRVSTDGGDAPSSSKRDRAALSGAKRKKPPAAVSDEASGTRSAKRPALERDGQRRGGSPRQEGAGTQAGEDVSDAAARRGKWLRAVEQNEERLKLELERIEREEVAIKQAHTSRNLVLMKWMVDEQSGEHHDEKGPPPMEGR